MADIPRQIDKKVRQEIAKLGRPWEVVKKRDHYFLRLEGEPPICVGSNASTKNENLVRRTLQSLRKIE